MKVKRKASNGRIAVSKHFHLSQFCGVVARPDPLAVKNIFALANRLEQLVAQRKEVPTIHSCYVPLDLCEGLDLPYDAQLAVAEAVEFYFPSETCTATGAPVIHRIAL